jgi:hypothetical protein
MTKISRRFHVEISNESFLNENKLILKVCTPSERLRQEKKRESIINIDYQDNWKMSNMIVVQRFYLIYLYSCYIWRSRSKARVFYLFLLIRENFVTFFEIFIHDLLSFINNMHDDHILNNVQIDSHHAKNVFYINIHIFTNLDDYQVHHFSMFFLRDCSS